MEYRERLTAPAWYWLVGIVIGVSTIVAVGIWYGPWVAFAGALVVVATITVGLAWASRIEVAVDPNGLRVGPSVLEWPWVGSVEPLDPDATREQLGPRADARAHVVLRPWLTEAVLVRVADPADPHPYWLVGSRRPEELAAAIEGARNQGAA